MITPQDSPKLNAQYGVGLMGVLCNLLLHFYLGDCAAFRVDVI